MSPSHRRESMRLGEAAPSRSRAPRWRGRCFQTASPPSPGSPARRHAGHALVSWLTEHDYVRPGLLQRQTETAAAGQNVRYSLTLTAWPPAPSSTARTCSERVQLTVVITCDCDTRLKAARRRRARQLRQRRKGFRHRRPAAPAACSLATHHCVLLSPEARQNHGLRKV